MALRVALVGTGMIEIPPPDYGAVEKHIWNLARALEDRGHEVDIVHEVLGEAPWNEYRFAWRARRSVRRLAPDVVHVHTPGVAWVFSTFGPDDFVFTSHSRHWVGTDGVTERIGFALERRACRVARRTIAVSDLVRERMEPYGIEAEVVPNGVDLDRYAPRWPDRSGRRIVGVGELAPHKRWHEAAAAIRGRDAELVHLGPHRSADYAERVREAAPGQVTLRGRVPEDELVEALAIADVLVHPSVSESFGMAVVEGMACGLPVVVSDFLDAFVESGRNGFLVPVDPPDRDRVDVLRDHLGTLLDDPDLRERMGRASRTIAEERYGWDAVAEGVEAVYRAATNGS